MKKLFPFQQRVLEQTKCFHRVGYFLDMGLGKTLIGGEKAHKFNADILLVVCQKSKVNDWIDHLVSQLARLDWIKVICEKINRIQDV